MTHKYEWTPEQRLARLAGTLAGIEYVDMTETEKQQYRILEAGDYLTFGGDYNEAILTSKSKKLLDS